MNRMDDFVTILNTSKVMGGISMLLLNIGAKYVIADLGIAHEKILNSTAAKKLILWAMFFVTTRDITTAFLLSLAYIVIVDGIFHEQSRYCILPPQFTGKDYKDNYWENYIERVNKI